MTRSQSIGGYPAHDQCGNGCNQRGREIRTGVGHLKIARYHCDGCGLDWKPAPQYPIADWNPDRAYAAGLSYASGCAE